MISSYIKRFALFFLLFATCVVSQNAFSDDTTKRYYHEFFNIHPSDDDVIVYLPCDGVMVFKKIYTSLNLKSKLRDLTQSIPLPRRVEGTDCAIVPYFKIYYIYE